MNRQKIFVLVTVLALLALTAGVLVRYRSMQKLGRPGVKTQPQINGSNLEVVLPETVLEYHSQPIETAQIVLETLPKDTSFGQRLYESGAGEYVQMNVVLMGADRSSLHKPQYCLPGNGFKIQQTEQISLPVTSPRPYTLPLIKLTLVKPATVSGGADQYGMYLYWYVADGVLSADASALQRVWLSTKKLLLTGELQRWAYISCFTPYAAGEEAACLERMQRFLTAAVPQFQLYTP